MSCFLLNLTLAIMNTFNQILRLSKLLTDIIKQFLNAAAQTLSHIVWGIDTFCSLICLCSSEVYIENSMNSDQTTPKGVV